MSLSCLIKVRLVSFFPFINILKDTGGPMDRLDWAFAGTSSTRPGSSSSKDGNDMRHLPLGSWYHWVDSRSDEAVKDQGRLLPTQSDRYTLEWGEMVNPATGYMSPYEECWRDLDVLDIDSPDDRPMKWSIVLITESKGVKGMVIRVGQYCQGIVRADGEVTIERWRWRGSCDDSEDDDSKDGEAAGWERIARLGRLFLPCALTFDPTELKVGAQIEYSGYEWEAREVYSFE